MQYSLAIVLAAATAAVEAHYSVTYPFWRGDSFKTQWEYPCGGVDQSISGKNRTLWPLDGGAIAFKPGHHWAQTQINIGLGEEVISFPTVLYAPFNQTGNGTFCFPEVPIPEKIRANITEGTKATIQVIQIASNGAGLFNCADIEFSSKAVAPPKEVCFNSTVDGKDVVGVEALVYGEIPKEQCDKASNSSAEPTEGGEAEKPADGSDSAGSMVKASTFGALLATAALVAGFMM